MLTLDEVLKGSDFTPTEIKQIKNHELIKGVLPSTNDRELAAKFALLIKGLPMDELRKIFIESGVKKETDSSIVQLVPLDPEAPDFSAVTLGGAYKDYLNPSTDTFNLSGKELDKFKALPKKASQAQVEQTLRDVLTARLNEYRQRGLEGISPYKRGRKDYEPGKELILKSEMASLMKKASPVFYHYLLDYPNAPKPNDLEESFSWINYTIDGKPTFVLMHKVGALVDGVYLFAQLHYYVSRGHNSVSGRGAIFPTERDDEVMFVYGSRTSTDQVAGFGGSAKRAVGVRIMGGKIAENLEQIRKNLESK